MFSKTNLSNLRFALKICCPFSFFGNRDRSHYFFNPIQNLNALIDSSNFSANQNA